MRVRIALVLAALMSVAFISCGVVGDGKVDPIDPGLGLEDTIATTTTVAPTTTELITTTSGLDTSTTAVPTEIVRLYYIASGQIVFVATPLPAGAALPQIIAALQAGPDSLGDLGLGLRSAIPRDAEIRATPNNAGVAVVQLPETFFDDIPSADQRLAVAQLVLTLTDSRGIGQVQFNQAVPKPSGALAPAGASLSRNDFQSLLDSSVLQSTTTSTVPAASSTAAP